MGLYSKCINTENIRLAIKEYNRMSSSLTAGPDGLTKRHLCKIKEEKVIIEVKKRLRRYVKVRSKTVEIPKKSGDTRTITIVNLYDRYAQQAVYRIINKIVEPRMSKHSYGFRTGISAKIPVGKVCSVLVNSKRCYTVEIDFRKCFDNIPLDKALNKLRELGVKDGKLIKTIKHLMYTSKEYKGVGLSQGTILGPLLCNCYLDILDRYMERTYSLEKRTFYKSDYSRHKGQYIKWLQSRGHKIQCKYYRYADDTLILTNIPEAREYIWNDIVRFISEEMEIEINEGKSYKRRNKTVFLGFWLKKSGHNVWIKPKEYKELIRRSKEFPLGSHKEVIKFIQYVIGILNYFDICNQLNKVLLGLYNHCYFEHIHTRYLRMNNDRSFSQRNRKDKIDIWKLRRETKRSFKDYLVKSEWLSRREFLIQSDLNEEEYYGYKFILFTKQEGKDKITGEKLNMEPGGMHIHHIIPRAKGGSDELENLILINTDTHRLLHSNEKLPDKYRKYAKHLK